MIEKITEYLTSNNELTGSMVSFLLKPENLEKLKDNKKLVKKLTKIKALPSSIRLYLRNLAGVTDKITEDFFSKSELKEIKKRVAEAEAEGNMGNNAVSGLTSTGTNRTNIIGYQLDKGKLSLSKAFTDPATNIDMTLGQATFTKYEKRNFIVKDKHNCGVYVGRGTQKKKKKYFGVRKENTQVVPHRDTYDSINEMLEDPNVSEKDKDFMKNIQTMLPNEAESYTQYESDKQILERAKNAFEAGDIDASKYARIVAGFQQGEEIPVELNIGKITQEDKLEANPNFAEYIAYDTEKIGIPTLIKNQARKFIK